MRQQVSETASQRVSESNIVHLKRARRISTALQGEAGCSMPGTHDRLAEGQYFLLQMLEKYHSPDEFRWNLHAFVQAVNSFAEIGLMESQNSTEFKQFRDSLANLTLDTTWKKLTQLRNEAVHKEPLLANASLWIGMYRYMKLKMAMQIPIPTHVPSWLALAKSRNEKIYVPPHREWIGEECGLERIWRLPQFQEEELAEVCAKMLSRCNDILSVSPGHSEVQDPCENMDLKSPRMMFEHDLFPEVMQVWDGDTPSSLVAKSDTIITLLPGDESTTLHEVAQGTSVSAWFAKTKIWNKEYSSLLLHSIGGVEVIEDTAGFYQVSAFEKTEESSVSN